MLDHYTDAARPVREEVAARRGERMEAAAIITEPQARRFNAIARSNGWAPAESVELLRRWGYDAATDIRRADYEAMCRALENRETRADVRARCDEAADRAAAAARLEAANRTAVNQIVRRR
jgi:hypothetical protein